MSSQVQSHPITLGVLLGVFTEIELDYFGLMSNTDAALLDVSTIPAVPPSKQKAHPCGWAFCFDSDTSEIKPASGTDAGGGRQTNSTCVLFVAQSGIRLPANVRPARPIPSF